VYERETRPLAQHYAAQGLLRTIDADAPVEEVTARLVAALACVPASQPAARAPRTAS
jgi:adenylate kinase family enzyme